jgi:hypothetical protein
MVFMFKWGAREKERWERTIGKFLPMNPPFPCRIRMAMTIPDREANHLLLPSSFPIIPIIYILILIKEVNDPTNRAGQQNLQLE